MFRPANQEKTSAVITVAPRSVYIMSGAARWRDEHRITPVKAVRHSLTFRSVTIMREESPNVKTTRLKEATTVLKLLNR